MAPLSHAHPVPASGTFDVAGHRLLRRLVGAVGPMVDAATTLAGTAWTEGATALARLGYQWNALGERDALGAVLTRPDDSPEWDEHDFFWVHYKESDVAAQDGDFHAKRKAIERLDEHLHDILTLKPDVLVVTGDHASPSDLGGHSWHPVPFVIRSAGTVGSGTDRFNEHDLRGGSLGQFESKHAMILTLAQAGKLKRFGA